MTQQPHKEQAVHTVEKIGGTSIAETETVLDNVIIAGRSGADLYNRIFVLSAYAGITDRLLEHKKTGKPGIYALFCRDDDSEDSWRGGLHEVCEEMRRINARIFPDKADRRTADEFIRDRIEGLRHCLLDLSRLCSYGHFKLDEHLMTVREMLSALGEAHSAFNTALLLQKRGINAQFIDLTGWRDHCHLDLDERIKAAFDGLDLATTLPIVTGYAQCNEGLVHSFDRGYTEITFSRIAVVTGAREAIIHKEYHLSSADPKIVPEERVFPIGMTNYDVIDQLSNLGMEAIHPRAAKGLRQSGIKLRVRNTFERDHEGTLICSDYRSAEPCVEIVAGRRQIYTIELFDQDMVGAGGYHEAMAEFVRRHGLKIITQDINANTIACHVAGPISKLKSVADDLQKLYPQARIDIHKVAIVAAIGSDMGRPGLLAQAVTALADEQIEILALHQTMRLADIQFIIREQDYERAIRALHSILVEAVTEDGQLTLAA